MSGRVAVVAGGIAGLTTVAVVIVAFVAATPTPTPPPAPSFQVPSPTPIVTPMPSPSPASSPSPSPGGPFHVGESAPALVVPELGGGTIDLARLKGKPVWVNFWGTYCPPCEDEFPLMNGYAAKHEDAGLVILAIDVREDEDTVAEFAQRLGAIFPIGLDAQGAYAADWDAIVLPVHYWVDVDGVIRAGAAGGIGPDQMEAGLATILPASGSPAPSDSPAPSVSPAVSSSTPAAAASPSP